MPVYDVDEIQSRVASIVDQSTDTPTQSGDEYALRLKYINRAYEEWATAYDWEALRRSLWVSITGVSQASVSMPTDFRKMAAFPRYYSGGVSGGEEWSEIKPEHRGLYTSSDKYFYILGYRENHTMFWNPGTLASGASLVIHYFSHPTSLASPADTLVVPDPEFIVDRTIAYILEARSDARFQGTEVKARERLLQMIDNEKNKGLSLTDDVMTDEQLFHSFRIGRD